jgi:cytochrome c6
MSRSSLLLVLSVLTLSFMSPAQAADASAGTEVFSKNCTACHAGGKNIMNPAKTLSLNDLKSNQRDSEGAIVTLVTNGIPPMPAFGKSLSEEQIKNVAAYVIQQANAGWK